MLITSPSPPLSFFPFHVQTNHCLITSEVDFKKFNADLQAHIALHPPPAHISTKQDFDSRVLILTSAIQQAIAENIPLNMPCLYTKGWWSKDLSAQKKAKDCLSNNTYKVHHFADHPGHEIYKQAAKEFAKFIDKAASEYWTDWLENISARQIYTANIYITNNPSDTSCTWIPALKPTTTAHPTQIMPNSWPILSFPSFPSSHLSQPNLFTPHWSLVSTISLDS
jgi:hypothetical protein